jgi:hypothetical protein
MAQGTPDGYTSQSQGSFVVGQEFNPYKLFTGICIPEAIVRHRGLSDGAKLAYGRLARYAGANGDAFPAVGTLADEIGKSLKQARRHLHELEAQKFIAMVPSVGRPNEYRFLWHEIFESTGTPRAAGPLPDLGGVKTPQGKNLRPPPPLPDLGVPPLPDLGVPPLPDLGGEESQCKESQEKRVSLFARACETIRAAVEHATGEPIHDDRLIYAMLEHGCGNDLPPAAQARCIEWLIYDRRAQGYRAKAGLALNIVREESVRWAKENGPLIFRLQMEARESGWSPEAMREEAGPQLALGAAFKIPSTSEKFPTAKTKKQTA